MVDAALRYLRVMRNKTLILYFNMMISILLALFTAYDPQ